MIERVKKLFGRDLRRLFRESEAFEEEAAFCQTGGDVKNSARNLCLHLCGTLQTQIRAVFGGTGYVRDRHAEF